MNAKQAIRAASDTSSLVLSSYLSDLTDADLMHRPAPKCNHLAWQTGHVIASNNMLLEAVVPGKSVTLPEGFAEQHSTENTADDDASKFKTKEEYLELMNQVQTAAMNALDELPDEKLDEPAPERFRDMFPTTGNMFILIATHAMMHAGQFVPVRRQLGKPVVI